MEPGEVAWVTVPDPAPPAGGMVVRIKVATICGSDLHFLHDSPIEDFPFEPGQSGHECVGVVEASNVPEYPSGTYVLALVPRFDGFADYVGATPEEVIRLPEGLDADRAVMAQQLGTVVYCCRKLENVVDKRVVVVGQGPAGLLFTMLLRSMGAREVIGLDIVHDRLSVSATVGAAETIDVRTGAAIAKVLERTDGRGADLVVEAVGKVETINLCTELVHDHGTIALFGVPKNPILPIAIETLLRKNVKLIASAYAQREPGLASFRLALELIAQGRLDPSVLITHRLPFGEIGRGLKLAESKTDGVVKVLLRYGD